MTTDPDPNPNPYSDPYQLILTPALALNQEGEDVDRYGLPTHWYQPPFSTAVHGFAGIAASDDASAGGAAADVAGDAAGDE